MLCERKSSKRWKHLIKQWQIFWTKIRHNHTNHVESAATKTQIINRVAETRTTKHRQIKNKHECNVKKRNNTWSEQKWKKTHTNHKYKKWVKHNSRANYFLEKTENQTNKQNVQKSATSRQGIQKQAATNKTNKTNKTNETIKTIKNKQDVCNVGNGCSGVRLKIKFWKNKTFIYRFSKFSENVKGMWRFAQCEKLRKYKRKIGKYSINQRSCFATCAWKTWKLLSTCIILFSSFRFFFFCKPGNVFVSALQNNERL